MSDAYLKLLARKKVSFEPRGLKRVPVLNPMLFDHQRHCVDFALRTGCSGAFLATGLGKSAISLDWGRVVVEKTNKPVLMLAPLAVSFQHEDEANKFGIDAKAIRDPSEITTKRVYVTNYERLHLFDTSMFDGVVIDEGSCIKAYTGAVTRQIMQAFAQTRFRLSATATPAPNDHMELGQQSQFLGAMDSNEMLARWFIADQTQMGKYRIKKAGINPFWDWVASWARCIDMPSDVGFSDDGFVLPELIYKTHVVEADRGIDAGAERDGQARLFRMPENSATSIHKEKRMTTDARADVVAGLVAAEPDEAWLVWCDSNYESDALAARIPGAVEVRGDQSAEIKEERLRAFASGQVKCLITKPVLAGFGLNLQVCARMAFIGISFSYEQHYQAVRRCWRFGQKRPVHAHVCMADTEKAIWDVVSRKTVDHQRMKDAMRAAMTRAMAKSKVYEDYRPVANVKLPDWIWSEAA